MFQTRRCQILEHNGIHFDPFNSTAAGLKRAMKTADDHVALNRELWGDVYDFSLHPDINKDADAPLTSLFYYVKDNGQTRTMMHQKFEKLQITPGTKGQLTLTDTHPQLELLDFPEARGDYAVKEEKEEIAGLLDLQDTAKQLKILG